MVRQDFQNKMTEIANILGYRVSFDERNNSSTLRKDRGIITVSAHWDEERFSIYSEYPRTIKGECANGIKDIKITVSENKTADQIAGAILRRFLPKYLEQLSKAVGDIDRRNVTIKDAREVAEVIGVLPKYLEQLSKAVGDIDRRNVTIKDAREVAEVIGVAVSSERQERRYFRTIKIYPSNIGIEVISIWSRKSIDISLHSLPLDKALKLVEFMKSL